MNRSKRLKRCLACLLALCCLCPAPFAAAAEQTPRRAPATQGIADDAPIKVTADHMTYDTEKNQVVFTGNVEAVREDFHLWSATLTLYLRAASTTGGPAEPGPAGALKPGDLDRIVAETNVRFTHRAQSGSAAKATYLMRDGLLTLEGKPVLRDGENSITGNVIRYYLNENRSEVDGGPKGRVQAVFSSNAPAPKAP